jgi:hypothetical protein
VSDHVLEDDNIRWIFGWNQNLCSFFLVKHDKTLGDEQNPVIRLGNMPRDISDADGLYTLALLAGLTIPTDLRLQLFRDKDYEKERFVLHYSEDFVGGFETDSLAHAELLKEALAPAHPGKELQIRRITRYS